MQGIGALVMPLDDPTLEAFVPAEDKGPGNKYWVGEMENGLF